MKRIIYKIYSRDSRKEALGKKDMTLKCLTNVLLLLLHFRSETNYGTIPASAYGGCNRSIDVDRSKDQNKEKEQNGARVFLLG